MEIISQPDHFWDRLESEYSEDVVQQVAAHAKKLPAGVSDDRVVLVLKHIFQAVVSGYDPIVGDFVTDVPLTFERDTRGNLDDEEGTDYIERAIAEFRVLPDDALHSYGLNVLHSASPTVIARGASATVQTCPDDPQAVEKCYTHVKASEGKREALAREVSIAFCDVHLRHKNVVHALGGKHVHHHTNRTPNMRDTARPINVEPDVFRMRMARFDGSLATRHGLTYTPLTFREIQVIAYQLLQGVRHMHDVMCVAHGDLKPANILLKVLWQAEHGRMTRSIRVAVADFGCAHNVDSKAFCGGTPAYLGYGTGRQKDAWAVGLVIGQLLAGDVEEVQASNASFYVQVVQNVIRGWMNGTVETGGLLLVLSLLDLCPENRPCMAQAMFSSFFDDELRAEFAEALAPTEAILVEENVINKRQFYQTLFASSILLGVTAGDADVS